MIRLLTFAILILLHRTSAFCQEIPNYYKSPVVFMSVTDQNKDKIVLSGTAFFCAVPLDSSRVWSYLVTTKHEVIDYHTQLPYSPLLVRVTNLKDSASFFLLPEITDKTGKKNVFFSDKPNVDLAVIPLGLNGANIKFAPINSNMLFKSKKNFDTSYVKEGTNIFYTGMFSPYPGYRKNAPIIRFGRVSLITDEEILWDSATNEVANLMLVETTTYGGNSGSPVFSYSVPFSFGSTRDQSKDSVKLLGIIKGSYLENTPLKFQSMSTSMIPTYTSNVGISGVIPSYFLWEILFGPELIELRNGERAKLQENK